MKISKTKEKKMLIKFHFQKKKGKEKKILIKRTLNSYL